MALPPPANQQTDDRLVASAARFLIDGGEEDAAHVLLSCSIALDLTEDMDIWCNPPRPKGTYYGDVHIQAHRSAYNILNDQENPIRKSIIDAIKAVTPHHIRLIEFIIKAEIIVIDPNWRNELLQIARGRGVHNQLADLEKAKVRTWNNLRFRSQSEVRLAIALDRTGVFFLPNCRGRLNTQDGRENREADFLVCCEGKWGILEVDGEPFHPRSRTVQDHERDRLFKAYGIRVVEHFDASECFENAPKVVEKFLAILKRSYTVEESIPSRRSEGKR
jgi:very-short-patch-repair endonuclease